MFHTDAFYFSASPISGEVNSLSWYYLHYRLWTWSKLCRKQPWFEGPRLFNLCNHIFHFCTLICFGCYGFLDIYFVLISGGVGWLVYALVNPKAAKIVMEHFVFKFVFVASTLWLNGQQFTRISSCRTTTASSNLTCGLQ